MLGAFARSRSSLNGSLRSFAASTTRKVVTATRWTAPTANTKPLYNTLRSFGSAPRLRDASSAAAVPAEFDEESDGSHYITKFAELGERGIISKQIVDTLTKSMGLTTMTPVQSQTINECLDTGDV